MTSQELKIIQDLIEMIENYHLTTIVYKIDRLDEIKKTLGIELEKT